MSGKSERGNIVCQESINNTNLDSPLHGLCLSSSESFHAVTRVQREPDESESSYTGTGVHHEPDESNSSHTESDCSNRSSASSLNSNNSHFSRDSASHSTSQSRTYDRGKEQNTNDTTGCEDCGQFSGHLQIHGNNNNQNRELSIDPSPESGDITVHNPDLREPSGVQVETTKQSTEHSGAQGLSSNASVAHTFIDIVKHLTNKDYTTSGNGKQIVTDVNEILLKCIQIMGEKNGKLFTGAYLIPTGSVAEHSKIGFPNEMDFMIILPQLEDERMYNVYETHSFHQLVHRWHDRPTDASPDVFTAALFREEFIAGFKAALDDFHHNDHQWTLFSFCFKEYASTLHVLCPSLCDSKVSIDVCFAFTSKRRVTREGIILATIIEEEYSVRSKMESHRPSSDSSQFLVNATSNLTCFEILPNTKNELRMSAVQYELLLLTFLPYTDMRLLCYRIAKYLVATILPTLFRPPCYLCEHSFIPSYYLKTALNRLIKKYDPRRPWEEDTLMDRLIELFSMLLNKMDDKRFVNVQSIFLDRRVSRKFSKPQANTMEYQNLPKELMELPYIRDKLTRFVTFLKSPPLITDFQREVVNMKLIMKHFVRLLEEIRNA